MANYIPARLPPPDDDHAARIWGPGGNAIRIYQRDRHNSKLLMQQTELVMAGALDIKLREMRWFWKIV